MFDSLRNYTRAGQTYSHNIRMWIQAIQSWFLKVFVSLFLFFFLSTFMVFTSHQQRNDMLSYVKVKPLVAIVSELRQAEMLLVSEPFEKQVIQEFEVGTPDGVLMMTMWDVDSYVDAANVETLFQRISLLCAVISAILAIIVAVFVSYWLEERGESLIEDELVRGSTFSEADKLTEMLVDAGKASDITVGGVPLLKDSEVQGGCIAGTQGSGKTQAIMGILTNIREKKQKAIIYDRKGTFVKKFYRPGKDVILNPFDQRSPSWSLWNECSEAMDFDNIAASMMPLNTGGKDSDGPFWVKAARTLFSVTANQMKKDPFKSSRKLLRYLLTEDMSKIRGLLAGTEAESLASEKVEKMALSVKAVLTNYTKCLKYVNDAPSEESFSIREWVNNDEDDSWIFISCQTRYREVLRPLMATWLDIACNAILELPLDPNRRIWMMMDELHTLHELPSLPEAIALGREYGFCPWYSIQSLAQLHKNFGEKATEELLDLANTFFFLRSNSDTTAEKFSRILGKTEVNVTNENISFGAHEMRDSVSQSKQDKLKDVVIASEIQGLNDLEGYLKLPGSWPVTKVVMEYKDYPDVAEPFIERLIKGDSLRDAVSETDPVVAHSGSDPADVGVSGDEAYELQSVAMSAKGDDVSKTKTVGKKKPVKEVGKGKNVEKLTLDYQDYPEQDSYEEPEFGNFL